MKSMASMFFLAFSISLVRGIAFVKKLDDVVPDSIQALDNALPKSEAIDAKVFLLANGFGDVNQPNRGLIQYFQKHFVEKKHHVKNSPLISNKSIIKAHYYGPVGNASKQENSEHGLTSAVVFWDACFFKESVWSLKYVRPNPDGDAQHPYISRTGHPLTQKGKNAISTAAQDFYQNISPTHVTWMLWMNNFLDSINGDEDYSAESESSHVTNSQGLYSSTKTDDIRRLNELESLNQLEDWTCEDFGKNLKEHFGFKKVDYVSVLDVILSISTKRRLMIVASSKAMNQLNEDLFSSYKTARFKELWPLTTKTPRNSLRGPAGDHYFTFEDLVRDIKEDVSRFHHHRGSNFAEKTRILSMIRKAQVLAFNGGNPETYQLAFQALWPELGLEIKQQVRHGDSVFLGRSAGSMAGLGRMLTVVPPRWILVLIAHLTHGEGVENILDANLADTGLDILDGVTIRPQSTPQSWWVGLSYFGNQLENEQTKFRPCFVPDDQALALADGKFTKLGEHVVDPCFPSVRSDLSPRVAKGFQNWLSTICDPVFLRFGKSGSVCKKKAAKTAEYASFWCVEMWRICWKQAANLHVNLSHFVDITNDQDSMHGISASDMVEIY